MSPFGNRFEKKWTAIMLFLYFFIMMPFPWYYNPKYEPIFDGIPNYLFGWIGHALVVIIFIIIWRNQCMKRPEYQDEELKREDKE